MSNDKGYTAGQYGCAFPFLVITAIIIVGFVVTGGKLIGWLIP